MTKEQLDNLIRFYFIFRFGETHFSDYIREKWDMCIGIKNVSDENIIKFISINNENKNILPSDLVENFGMFFDINDIHNIAKHEYALGMHPILRDSMVSWKERYLRDYNLTWLV